MGLTQKRLFSSESVSEGHSDKICDQISDAVLDAYLSQDPNARVACEVLATGNNIIIAGEISSCAKVNYKKIVQDVLKNIGYNNIDYGCDWRSCNIEVLVQHQSPEIAVGVDRHGAGDQGIMFGYATNESANYMPLPIAIAHDLVKTASRLRHNKLFKWARPDMKSEVTIDYSNPAQPRIENILMSIQHDPDYSKAEFLEYIKTHIMQNVAQNHGLNTDFSIMINPCGPFCKGGPASDTGLTGRKIIIDTYGGSARHGGGCFSGKDPSKVDRTGAYMARYVAKNIVAAGLADRCEVQVAYAIGIEAPTSISVNCFGTEHINNDDILMIVQEKFDFRPQVMIDKFDLKKPIYAQTAVYGHFGRPHHRFPWEKLDMVEQLKEYLPRKV